MGRRPKEQHSGARFADLTPSLYFEVARLDLSALPALFPVSTRLRNALREELGRQTHLLVREREITCGLAELLARELPRLALVRTLQIQTGHVVDDISMEELCTAKVLERPFSSLQAMLLAPFLRSNASLELVAFQGDGCALSVKRLHHLKKGSVLEWCSIQPRNDPYREADCVMVAGLIRVVDDTGQAISGADVPAGAVTLEVDTFGLGLLARRALAVASRRCGLCVWELNSVRRKRPEPARNSGAWFCWVLLLLGLPILMLRVQEDQYAKQTGFAGALLPHHPLKTMSFADRLQFELLTSGAG